MSFHDIENPTGGMPMERVIDQPTPEQHLLERIRVEESFPTSPGPKGSRRPTPVLRYVKVRRIFFRRESKWRQSQD